MHAENADRSADRRVRAFSFHCLARGSRLLLAILPAVLLTACNHAPHSSPTALRDTNAYCKAIAPAAPGALDPQALDHFTITHEDTSILVTYPSNNGAEEGGDGFAHAVDRLKPGEKLEGDEASFEFVAFAASGPGISKASTNMFVPLEYFSPGGKLLDESELKRLGFQTWDLTEYVGGNYGEDYSFPQLKVVYGARQSPPGYCTPVGLFDARTKQSLVGGYSYSQISRKNLGHVELHPRAWQATPMELVLDVELDGKCVIETNPIPDLVIPVPGGRVKLLGLWDGYSGSWSGSSSGNGPTTARFGLDTSGKETNAVALYATEPPGLAVHVEILDAQGKEFEAHGGGTSGAIRVAGFRGRTADVDQVRFTVFTNHHRVVLTLPPIPNLPPEYQHVANLFDVRIPRVKVQREYDLQRLISDATQMKFAYTRWQSGMQTNSFPLDLTNVTPAQLVHIYQGNLTNGCMVVVDEQKQEIRVEPTPLEKVKSWLKQKLRL